MNLILATIFSIVSGMLAGGALAILFFLIYNKFKDKKIIKQIPAEELAEQALNNKPQISEKEVAEDDRRRIEKIRQFEKLRRVNGKVQSTPSFYTGKFENEGRSNLQNESDRSNKLNSPNNGEDKSDDSGTIRFY